MPEVMLNLRRSPRKLLERDGHPGPGPGRLAMVMARAGTGKTAFLVDLGLDALLAGQKVLHVTLDGNVEKVRAWYDDILSEMLTREKKLEHYTRIQLDVERRRHIHAYVGHAFTADKLRESIAMLKDVMHFEPQVIIFDEIEADGFDATTVKEVKEVAKEANAELWMACQIYRDDLEGKPGHLPPPADQVEDDVDLAFRLDPHERKIRVHVLKDREKMLDEDLHMMLDPKSMLLKVSFGA